MARNPKARCGTEETLMSVRDYFMGLEHSRRSTDEIMDALEHIQETCERYHTDDGILALNRAIEEHRNLCGGKSQ